MKLTKQQLKQIVEEEMTTLANEGVLDALAGGAGNLYRALKKRRPGHEDREQALSAPEDDDTIPIDLDNRGYASSPPSQPYAQNAADASPKSDWERQQIGTYTAPKVDPHAEREAKRKQRKEDEKKDKGRAREKAQRILRRATPKPLAPGQSRRSAHEFGGRIRGVGAGAGSLKENTKLTKQQLEQIIREELLPLLSEVGLEHDPTGGDAVPYEPVQPDPFSPEGKEYSRKVTPTYVQGPAKILSDRNGKQMHLVTVGEGESVMIRFEDE